MAERGLELMVVGTRAASPSGARSRAQGVIREWIAESRIEIEQARLLVLKAAWLMDTAGNKRAQSEIAAIKVVAPRLACSVTDRAIQAFGGAGVSDDFPLASMYAGAPYAAARRRPGRGAPARRRATRVGAARRRRGGGGRARLSPEVHRSADGRGVR